jgi:predicted nucleotidyltransferase
MAEDSDKPALVRVAEHLDRFGVEFLVIGGQAAALFGSPVPTYDVDLCYRRTADNLERLAAAPRELHPTLRGAPPDLPFRVDGQSLALGSNFTLSTDFGQLDLLGWVEPIGTYEELIPRAEHADLDTVVVAVIGFDDLLRIKRHLGRPKDRAALVQLEAIERDRREGTPPNEAS